MKQTTDTIQSDEEEGEDDADWLSSTVYRLQMVRNKLDPDSHLQPDIVHCGKKDSKRSLRFHDPGIVLVDKDGKPAGLPNCRGLKSFNTTFAKLFARLRPVLLKNPHLSIPISTKLEKQGVLYRADPCSQHCASAATEDSMWCDWAIFLFTIRGRTRQYPGQIIGFVNFDPITAAAFNSVYGKNDVAKTGGLHSLAELTQNPLNGFLDPGAAIETEQQLQPNSSLFFWEKKETIDNAHNVRCIPILAIHGPILALADFAPEFQHKKDRMVCTSWIRDDRVGAFVFVRPRLDWAELFVQKARKAYREHKEEERVAKRLRETNKLSPLRPKKKKG
jgi:hypothetical protein